MKAPLGVEDLQLGLLQFFLVAPPLFRRSGYTIYNTEFFNLYKQADSEEKINIFTMETEPSLVSDYHFNVNKISLYYIQRNHKYEPQGDDLFYANKTEVIRKGLMFLALPTTQFMSSAAISDNQTNHNLVLQIIFSSEELMYQCNTK